MSGSWADKLLASLRLVRDHQELVNVIGLKVLSDREFAAHAGIYAIFTGRRQNTVNYGFRTHLIPSEHSLPREFSGGLLDWKNWKLHTTRNNIFDRKVAETFPHVRHPEKLGMNAIKENSEFISDEWVFGGTFSAVEDWESLSGLD
jgi:hypothetical protein